MNNKLLAAMLFTAMSTVVPPSLADDEEGCMECHEPAEDWEGMSSEEIFIESRDPDNKRHKYNQALSDEQLKALISTLMEE